MAEHPWRREWRRDLTAGLSVAAVALPAGLGMGELAGVGPMAGLYAAMFPLLAYLFLGTSRQLVIGPEGVLASATALTIAPIAAGDPALLAPLAAGLALCIGAVQVAAGALRLGFMADFLSRPMLLGYINGVACIIVAGQLGKTTGVPVESTGFFPQVRDFVLNLDRIHWRTVLLTAAALAVVFLVRRLLPRVPAMLAAVVLATAASAVLRLSEYGIAVVGELEGGLPRVGLPTGLSLDDYTTLLLPAVGLALVGFADAAAITRTYADKHGYRVDANRDLIALGASNAVSGLAQGMPTGSSGSRTAVNDANGGFGPATALVTAVAAVLTAAFAAPLIEPMPEAVLGVVVIVAGLGLVDLAGFRRLRRVGDSEMGLAVVAFLGVLVFNVLGGLLVAIGVSVGVYVYRSLRPHDAVLRSVSDVDGWHSADSFPSGAGTPGLLVYRFDAPLYFANAAYFKSRLLGRVGDDTEWVVFNAEAVNYLDATGVDALSSVADELRGRGVSLRVARLRADLRDTLRSTGVADKIPMYLSVRAAVAEFDRVHGEDDEDEDGKGSEPPSPSGPRPVPEDRGPGPTGSGNGA